MPESPRIETVSWGCMTVEGAGTFKDAKVWPGAARSWDWRETGTRHVPGIQFADLEELLERGAEEIILSRGMLLVLRVCAETLDRLCELQVPVHVLETRKAVAKFNELRAQRPVGGLFHTTC